ncbi:MULTISPECIES: hypothetical protein [unclassified Mesorhizobium]|uniref:hypothetical protein n=1 Tax=unclassified Mesorhizobium TaxID=325217 RepID=UPI00142ECCB8|nr:MULTISPECIES: hypothetical protein [unclassified Mesorhizobium]
MNYIFHPERIDVIERQLVTMHLSTTGAALMAHGQQQSAPVCKRGPTRFKRSLSLWRNQNDQCIEHAPGKQVLAITHSAENGADRHMLTINRNRRFVGLSRPFFVRIQCILERQMKPEWGMPVVKRRQKARRLA